MDLAHELHALHQEINLTIDLCNLKIRTFPAAIGHYDEILIFLTDLVRQINQELKRLKGD